MSVPLRFPTMIPIGPWQRSLYNGTKDLPWDVAPLPKGKKSDLTANFAPAGGETLETSIVDALNNAQKVRVLAFLISDPNILQALQAFQQDGRDIRGGK